MSDRRTYLDIEERQLFLPATGLLSYRLHVDYDEDSLNWMPVAFDLLEEVQPPGHRLSYRLVPLQGYRPDAPDAAIGLCSLIAADACSDDVAEMVLERIRADIADRRERAAEERECGPYGRAA